jgi:hypothetical protein
MLRAASSSTDHFSRGHSLLQGDCQAKAVILVPGVQGDPFLSAAPSRLQDVYDQEKHESQHNDGDKNEVPKASSGTSVIVEFAPVPQVRIIRVGRHGTYWRGHQPSVSSAQSCLGLGTGHTQEVDDPYNTGGYGTKKCGGEAFLGTRMGVQRIPSTRRKRPSHD